MGKVRSLLVTVRMLDYTANLLVSRRHWKAKGWRIRGIRLFLNRPNEGD